MSDVTLFTATDGHIELKVQFLDDTVWLSQKQLAALFDKDLRTINEHIQHVYQEGELVEAATVRHFRRVQTEGRRQVERHIAHYDLDVIISVGYRVHSQRGTEFRQWATKRLKDHLMKGYTVNSTRLAERGVSERKRQVKDTLYISPSSYASLPLNCEMSTYNTNSIFNDNFSCFPAPYI